MRSAGLSTNFHFLSLFLVCLFQKLFQEQPRKLFVISREFCFSSCIGVARLIEDCGRIKLFQDAQANSVI